MDMSSSNSTSGTCQISMLWNWTVIDACFLTSGWHIKNRGSFAASCVGVFFLGMILEALRRLSREYDAFALRQLAQLPSSSSSSSSSSSPKNRTHRATALQQLIRATLHALTFGVAYILMLLAMYYNGYIIISIFLGAGVGKFLCDWLVYEEKLLDKYYDDPTVCCG